jgi:hypothetical protein
MHRKRWYGLIMQLGETLLSLLKLPRIFAHYFRFTLDRQRALLGGFFF